jgi:DNA-directed RNA polymerase subunit RPC12/RpoP
MITWHNSRQEEVIHEVPTEPPPPQLIQCPYCGGSYVPAQTNYACPNCGAASPEDTLSRDAGST